MQRHIFDENQPQGSMSLMNLRNTLRGLFQGDLMPLRPRASMILDDMEYPSDAAAQSQWSGTGVTVTSSTTKQEGNYALQVVIDATGNRKLTRTKTWDLSAFKTVKLWQRCSAASSAITFYLRDSSGNESYWNITTNATIDTWQQDTLDLTTPDSNNGTNATLSAITEFGFQGLDASTTYIFDTIKAICGLNVAVEASDVGSFYKQVYVSTQPLETNIQSSPSITPPSANPRIDILKINSSGTLAFITGTEAASPVPDWASLANNEIPICLVYCKTTMTKIVDYEDKDANPNEGYIYADVRPFIKLGILNFLGLTDTPSSYSGQSAKAVVVKATEDGLEFGVATEFRSGDLMLSSNTSAPSGWTDVSATYTEKFIRISSGTPLTTAGADTHTHGAGNYASAAHTHGAGSYASANHYHNIAHGSNVYQNASNPIVVFGSGLYPNPGSGGSSSPAYSYTETSGSAAISGTSASGGGGAITGTSASANNIPAYVQLRLFKKN